MPDTPHSPVSDTQDLRYAILEGAPALLWLGDVEGNCVFLNRAQREFWGVAPDLADFSWATTVHPEDIGKLAAPYTVAMRDRVPFEVEVRYRRADGAWRILHTQARPRFAKSGEFLGMVGVNTDVTEQRAAEQALRQTAGQLEFALDAAAGMGTWVWNVAQDRITGDRRFAAALDLPVHRVLSGVPFAAFLALVVVEDRAGLKETLTEAFRSGEICRCEFRVATPAGPRWLSTVGRCDMDEDGQPQRFAGVTMDIGDRKAREQQLDLLTRELSHRIKNIFAVLGSMTRMEAREHPAAADAFNALAERMTAMAAAYAHVTPAADRPWAPGRLLPLLDQIFAPYASAGGGGGIVVQAPDLPLDDVAASSLALILHELATNSAKYGALADGGEVRFTVAAAGDSVTFTWSEATLRRDPPSPAAEGFGTRLIQMSARSIGGEITLEWLATGLLWQMTVPRARLG